MNATGIHTAAGIMAAEVDTACDVFLDRRFVDGTGTDGACTDEARWALDRRMMQDAELVDAVQLQQRVTESVRRRFEAPDLTALVLRVEAAATAVATAVATVDEEPAMHVVGGPPPEPSRWFLRRAILCAVALLLFGVWLWSGDGPDENLLPGEQLARVYESNLVEAMALGVAGAAAIVGSRRLSRGAGGRFVLEEHGMRMVLPVGVEDAIALHTRAVVGRSAAFRTIVFRTLTGDRAVVVVGDQTVKVPLALPPVVSLRWRRLGDVVLYQLDGQPNTVSQFEWRRAE